MKLNIIIFTFLVYVKAESPYITSENATHIINDSFYDPNILKFQNQLVYVSYPKYNDDIFVKLESTAIINNTCNVTFPVRSSGDLISPKAAILGNGKIIVAYVLHYVEKKDLDGKPHTKICMISLDLKCTLKFLSAIQSDEEILQSQEPFSIIPYEDSFDLFVRNGLHCKPPGSICLVRHNDKGEYLNTFNFEFPTENNVFVLEHIYPIRQFDSSSGYIYFSKHTSMMRSLDANFKVIKEIKLHDHIAAHSVLNDDVGVCCHVDGFEARTECFKLDYRLKVKANVSLINSHYFAAKRFYNLADGSSLIVSISWNNINTFIRRLSADGRISLSELYRYDCEGLTTEPKDQFLELKGGIYCFSFKCNFKTITHCIKSSEATNLSKFS